MTSRRPFMVERPSSAPFVPFVDALDQSDFDFFAAVPAGAFRLSGREGVLTCDG